MWQISEIKITSEQRTKGSFPKCPLFGGSTVLLKEKKEAHIISLEHIKIIMLNEELCDSLTSD